MRRSSTPGSRRRTMVVTAAAAVALFGSVLPVHAAPADHVPPGIERSLASGTGAVNGALNGNSPVFQPVDGEFTIEQWVWVRPR